MSKKVKLSIVSTITLALSLSIKLVTAGEISIDKEVSEEVFQMKSQSVPPSKEYLVVLLHGIDHNGEQMSHLMLSIREVYEKLYPQADIKSLTDKFDFFYPTALNNKWFEIPSTFAIPGLMYAALRHESLTDKLSGFRHNLTILRKEIEGRLEHLHLGYDRLIIGGLSQGGITALTFGLESPQSFKAIVSAIGMWMPCAVQSYPHHIILTNGDKDEKIPGAASKKAEMLLRYALSKNQRTPLTNLKIINFSQDAHEVSKGQLSAIVRFLDENVFKSTSNDRDAMSVLDFSLSELEIINNFISFDDLDKLEQEALIAHYSSCFSRVLNS